MLSYILFKNPLLNNFKKLSGLLKPLLSIPIAPVLPGELSRWPEVECGGEEAARAQRHGAPPTDRRQQPQQQHGPSGR